MLAQVPPLVTDAAAWAGAAVVFLTLAGLIGRWFTREVRRAVRDEVPPAVEMAFPDVTRALIREEVEHVIEPRFSQLRAELKPNGGSSFSDRMNARMDTLEEGQAKMAEQLREMQQGGE